jgi:hypothetical protein
VSASASAPDDDSTRQRDQSIDNTSWTGETPGSSAVTPRDATTGMAAGQPALSGEQMKRRNPFAAWIGLPLITLGIYHFVWYYKIHREMRDFDRRKPFGTVGPVLVILLLSWTIVAPLISFFRTGNRIAESQRTAGLPRTCVPVIGMLLMLVFGVGVLYFQMELNKVVDRYGGSSTPPGTPVPLYV